MSLTQGPLSELLVARKRCLDLIAALSVKSEVSAAVLDTGPPDGSERDIGGNRPPGGVDRKGDRQPDFAMKSADHFKRRFAGCKTVSDYELVSVDAEAAILAWEKTPIVLDVRPGDPFFRRKVCELIILHPDWSDEKIGIECGGVSRQRINRIRLEEKRAA